jgi:hypothetical protein
VLRRARTDLIGPSICAPTTPKFSNRKKSLAAGWGVNQGTKDLPLPIKHLLPSLHHLTPLHILHGTFYYNTHTHLRFVALHPFPPSNHLRRSHSVGICQHGKHRQRYIQSHCTNASALVVGTHSLRVVNTLNGLSAGVKHRLAAWAPWAYQRINFASGLT